MKIGAKQKLAESGSGENAIQTFVITARRRSCLIILETAHVKIGHERTRGKRHCFVCDSQKHSLYRFLSQFLFLPSSHGS